MKLYSNNKQHDLTNPGRNSASNAPMSEGSRSDQLLVSYGFWLLVCFLAFLYIIVTQHNIHLQLPFKYVLEQPVKIIGHFFLDHDFNTLQEMKENNKRFKQLLQLLKVAYQERDEARDQLQKVLNKVMSSSSLEFLIDRPQIQLESPLIKPT